MAPPQWTTKIEFQKDLSEGNETFWIDSFENRQLSKAVREALSKNPDILGTMERVIAAGENAVASGAGVYPSFHADLSGTRSKRNLIGFNFPNGDSSFTSKSFNSGISVSWEIDLWGKRRDIRNLSEKRFEATKEELEAARLSLAGQVAKAWFERIENEGQIRLAQETAKTYSQTQSFIENRFEKGLRLGLGGKPAHWTITWPILLFIPQTQTCLSENSHYHFEEIGRLAGIVPWSRFRRPKRHTRPSLT